MYVQYIRMYIFIVLTNVYILMYISIGIHTWLALFFMQSVQLVTALKSLLKRVHIYEVIVSVKSAVERYVQYRHEVVNM